MNKICYLGCSGCSVGTSCEGLSIKLFEEEPEVDLVDSEVSPPTLSKCWLFNLMSSLKFLGGLVTITPGILLVGALFSSTATVAANSGTIFYAIFVTDD